MLSSGVGLSVHPFVMVDCIHTAEDIVKLLSRPGSHVILVFLIPSAGTQLLGEPLERVRKIDGWINFVTFDWKRRLSRKRYEIGPWLLTLIESHRWRIDLCRFRWPWVTSDPDFKNMTFFEVEYLKREIFWKKNICLKDKVTIAIGNYT